MISGGGRVMSGLRTRHHLFVMSVGRGCGVGFSNPTRSRKQTLRLRHRLTVGFEKPTTLDTTLLIQDKLYLLEPKIPHLISDLNRQSARGVYADDGAAKYVAFGPEKVFFLIPEQPLQVRCPN